MNKEQRKWLSICIISGTIYMTLMSLSLYDIRFKYGIFIVISTAFIAYFGIVMFALTQYMSTKEIVSIIIWKVKDFFNE